MAVIRRLLLVLLIASAPAVAQTQSGADPQALAVFARQEGLRDIPAFVATVRSLRETGHLPEAYIPKDAAEAHGWHGGGLCEVWPGHMIGGDPFRDFDRKLPETPGRLWHEADLDETCRSRSPERLIFANDGLIYITIDHYRTFAPVP